MPGTPLLRARAWVLAELINSGIHPLQNRYVLEQLKARAVDPVDWSRHFIARGLAALEAEAKRSSGPYLLGEQLTVPDVLLIPQLYNARLFEVDYSALTRLRAIDECCRSMHAFQRAAPENQVDAET